MLRLQGRTRTEESSGTRTSLISQDRNRSYVFLVPEERDCHTEEDGEGYKKVL